MVLWTLRIRTYVSRRRRRQEGAHGAEAEEEEEEEEGEEEGRRMGKGEGEGEGAAEELGRDHSRIKFNHVIQEAIIMKPKQNKVTKALGALRNKAQALDATRKVYLRMIREQDEVLDFNLKLLQHNEALDNERAFDCTGLL